MSCIIADSGPLIALAGVELLHLPQAVYGRCLVTESVLQECQLKPERLDAILIGQALARGWLARYEDPVIPDYISRGRLDPGETTALAAAAETCSTVLLDEERGRRAAKQWGIPVIGICGLILLAKREGKISSVLSVLTRMQKNGYFLSDVLIRQIANMANE